MFFSSPEKLTEAARVELAKLVRPLTPKQRLALPLQEMPAQYPVVRRGNMNEVALGYSEEQARLEAERCLQCPDKPCVKGCPVRIDIPAFIKKITEGDYQAAIGVIRESSLLPAVCGRVCPQESQCQQPCTVGKVLKSIDKAVSIGRLERYVADWERENGLIQSPTVKKPATGKKVGVIGSGPASITVAADVRREGHEVTVFEAFHRPGGVLLYGIPEFRLPKAIVDQEIASLKAMGVEIKTDFVIGRTRRLTDLLEKDGYDALFIGTGAGLPKFMNIEGENLVGVFSANEYLTRANLMKGYDSRAATPIFPSKKVAVLGGGNVAMDAARSAVRLGAEEVHLLYRRTEAEMPARIEEVAHAKEEGVIFHTLRSPKRILADERGWVSGMEVLKYELGEPDDSGRRSTHEINGSEFEMEVDTVIVAIGNESNPLIRQTTPGLETGKHGTLIVDHTGKTSLDRVFAGGDIVLGAATVILAMGEGRRAAAAINKLLAEK